MSKLEEAVDRLERAVARLETARLDGAGSPGPGRHEGAPAPSGEDAAPGGAAAAAPVPENRKLHETAQAIAARVDAALERIAEVLGREG
jgi:hypothetical protein